MNHLQLKLIAETEKSYEHCAEPISVDIEILVDGSIMEPEHFVHPVNLVKSTQSSGVYEIFVCSCGIAGCAGIFEDVKAEVTADVIVWRFLEPMSVYGKDFSGNPVSQSQKSLVFSRRQVNATIQDFDREFDRLLAKSPAGLSWPILGVVDNDLIAVLQLIEP